MINWYPFVENDVVKYPAGVKLLVRILHENNESTDIITVEKICGVVTEVESASGLITVYNINELVTHWAIWYSPISYELQWEIDDIYQLLALKNYQAAENILTKLRAHVTDDDYDTLSYLIKEIETTIMIQKI